jgi:hypothetical protein
MAKKDSIQWTHGLVTKTFGLHRIYEGYPLLDEWLTVNNHEMSDIDKELLEIRRQKLLRHVNAWNVETLKMKFIAFVLDMADYDVGNFQGIFEAEMSASVHDHALKVIADFTVATVIEDLIEKPYFYFHEYKQKKNAKDPIAQVLVAMLIAQEKNQDNKPIYGCHVIGELWHFMVMHKQDYSIHKGLNATDPAQLQQILLVLRKFKDILLTQLAN